MSCMMRLVFFEVTLIHGEMKNECKIFALAVFTLNLSNLETFFR